MAEHSICTVVVRLSSKPSISVSVSGQVGIIGVISIGSVIDPVAARVFVVGRGREAVLRPVEWEREWETKKGSCPGAIRGPKSPRVSGHEGF